MDYGFAFQLGQIVTHKAMLVGPGHAEPQRLFITSRLLEECSGGVQRLYMVTAMSASYGREQAFSAPFRMFELELAPYPQAPSRA